MQQLHPSWSDLDHQSAHLLRVVKGTGPERRRGPRRPDRTRRALWSYVQALGAATAYRAACEAGQITDETLFIVATDSASVYDTDRVVAEHFPDTPRRQGIGPTSEIVSGHRAAEMLGFCPTRSWRDEMSMAELVPP